MKGITPVITTVLLLLMAVAAVGGAWVWYQRMQTSSMAGGSSQIESMVGGAATLAVDKVKCITTPSNYAGGYNITILCVTTGSITIDEVKIYNSTAGIVGSETGSTNLTFATNTLTYVVVVNTSTAGGCVAGRTVTVDLRKGVNYFQKAYPITISSS
jgi:flagellin-like protein